MRGNMRQGLGFLLAASGIGLCGYAGLQWYQMPRYSEDDLKASAKLNLQLDLARSGAKEQPDPARMEQLRQQVRADIQREVETQRRQPLIWLAAGLGLLVIGGGRLLSTWLLRTRQVAE
jgi:hypothetical protein